VSTTGFANCSGGEDIMEFVLKFTWFERNFYRSCVELVYQDVEIYRKKGVAENI
jgi:hypothetical protein